VTRRIVAILVALLLASMVALVAGCGNLPKDAVAKVGSFIITQKAFDQRVADFEIQYAGQVPNKTTDPANYKLFQQDVLEYMITYQLASQAAPAMKITVTDADVQTQIDSIKTSTFGGDQAQFDAALKQQGITLDQLKASYKESMLLQKVYDQITKTVTTVPDSEISAYYNSHKSDYFVAETRSARHILLMPVAGRTEGTTSTTSTTSTTAASTGSSTASSNSTASSGATDTTVDTSTATASSSTTTTAAPTQADWDSALAAAKLVEAQLKAGVDWSTEAKLYSDDPGSKETGGDLGVVQKGQMVQEFENAVYSQKLDQISDPVKSAYGYHIIQVTAITAAKQYTLAEVKDDIKSTLLSTKQQDAWKAWVQSQKTKVGVVYASAWVTTTTTAGQTTTTAAGTDDTSAGAATTAAGSTDTTLAPATTTTAPATITTAAATSTSVGATDTTTAP
jgi:parvulin-like peptidyl-prolyl isomerase